MRARNEVSAENAGFAAPTLSESHTALDDGDVLAPTLVKKKAKGSSTMAGVVGKRPVASPQEGNIKRPRRKSPCGGDEALANILGLSAATAASSTPAPALGLPVPGTPAPP